MNDDLLLRYSRQIMLPEIDIDGQEKLNQAKVLIIGLGGLGSPIALYLAAAGVGNLILNDFDEVDLTNLQRQIVHSTADIGRAKVSSAQESLTALNPLINISCIGHSLDQEELIQQANSVDVVVDATDNLGARMAINKACVQTHTPLVSGAAIRLEGQISVYLNDNSGAPCYRCLYRSDADVEETCSQSGVIAPLLGIIGSMQALETMKLIIGFGETLSGKLLLLDAFRMEWHNIKLSKNKTCPVCTST